jgi:DNA repair protein RadC
MDKVYKTNLPEISIKYKSGTMKKFKIIQSKNIFDACKELLNLDTVELSEEALCFYLNKANNTIGWKRISQGGISGTVMDPRIIFQGAILSGATSIILIHNHPSCNINPSETDKNITQKVKEGAKYFDIQLLDHLIISGDLETYFSFADEGEL